ncbi:MAG: branched-chain amino acid ABC transporter permease [Polyangiaceae bacterium]
MASVTGILERLADAIVTGLAQGSMIALVALGYTMVYGVLRLINFAHGEVFMAAAYAGLFAMAMLGGASHPAIAGLLGTVLAMAAAAGLGMAIERVAYRPLRGRVRGSLGRVTPLVTAIGCSVFLQNLAQLVFTARFRPYPRIFDQARPVIFVTALVVMALLEIIVRRTWFGKALRALSVNEEAARLMGIRTSRVISATFALGSALAAVGAVLYCLDQSQVYPTMGFVIGTRAFVAAVLGGIGSLSGAMLGGLLIGVLGELVKLTDYSGGVDVLVFLVLIAVLLVRPAGLLGRMQVEKV